VTKTRLDGWKQISAHLGLSPRQSQRLAETAGLPVRRRGGTRAVFAWVEEIDSWIEQSDQGPASRLYSAQAEEQAVGEGDSRPGRHVPVQGQSLARQEPEVCSFTAVPESRDRGSRDRPKGRVRLLLEVLVVVGALVVFLLWWRDRNFVRHTLSGIWHRDLRGISGSSEEIGRFDTGDVVGPGATVSALLAPRSGRWSGGLEIYQDGLHRTQIALSPSDLVVHVKLMPTGRLLTLAAPKLKANETIDLKLTIHERSLTIALDSQPARTISMGPWDVAAGRLMLTVGYQGDEFLEPHPGTCSFSAVRTTPGLEPVEEWEIQPSPEAPRLGLRYLLAVDNVDDQVDILVDGKRLLSVAFLDRVEGFDLGPFLTPGDHHVEALVFNRKWSATYHVRLTADGEVLWDERCGTVDIAGEQCHELGFRLGMARRLELHFTAR
jgi:hypothetical protein